MQLLNKKRSVGQCVTSWLSAKATDGVSSVHVFLPLQLFIGLSARFLPSFLQLIRIVTSSHIYFDGCVQQKFKSITKLV